MRKDLPDDVREYLLSMLVTLGQMDHIATKVACEHVKAKAHIVPHNGIMVMSVESRRDLIVKGWHLLQKESP